LLNQSLLSLLASSELKASYATKCAFLFLKKQQYSTRHPVDGFDVAAEFVLLD